MSRICSSFSWRIRRNGRKQNCASCVLFACFMAYMILLTRAAKQNSVKKTSQSSGPDPIVALEGQCVIVCDSTKVAVEPQKPETADTSPTKAEDQVTTKLWDKMQSSCGDLVSLTRQSKKVAFSAVRNSELSDVNQSPILVFDNILVNVGNGFDTSASVFKAPVSGVYSFSFQVFRIFNKTPLYVDLKLNGKTMLQGFADGDAADKNSAHNQGLLHLAEADRVYLEMSRGDSSGGWKYSTFSGFLVFDD